MKYLTRISRENNLVSTGIRTHELLVAALLSRSNSFGIPVFNTYFVATDLGGELMVEWSPKAVVQPLADQPRTCVYIQYRSHPTSWLTTPHYCGRWKHLNDFLPRCFEIVPLKLELAIALQVSLIKFYFKSKIFTTDALNNPKSFFKETFCRQLCVIGTLRISSSCTSETLVQFFILRCWN